MIVSGEPGRRRGARARPHRRDRRRGPDGGGRRLCRGSLAEKRRSASATCGHARSGQGHPEIFAEFRRSIARQRAARLRCTASRRSRPPRAAVRPGHQARARAVRRAVNSPEAKAQRYVFFAEREAAKIPEVPKIRWSRNREAAVVGAGTMGGGIAMASPMRASPSPCSRWPRRCSTGARPRPQELRRDGRARAPHASGREKRLGRIQGTTDWEAIAGADLVIEAVFEEMPLKKEVFAKLDGHASPTPCSRPTPRRSTSTRSPRPPSGRRA